MKHFKFCLAVLVCAMAAAAHALESDIEQPVEIESDRAEFNEKDGITTYSGNVVLTQGTIKLIADKIELRSADSRIVALIAEGQPAHYQQLPELDAEILIARANLINYQLETEQIELVGNASLSQQGTTLSGGTILYDVRAHSLLASSQTEGQQSQERVRVTLPPLNSSAPE